MDRYEGHWDCGWLPEGWGVAPGVEGSTPKQIPLSFCNLPWKLGPIISETALPQPLSRHRTHPKCSCIEKMGRGTQKQGARGGLFLLVPTLPHDSTPKHSGPASAAAHSGPRDGASSMASLRSHLHSGRAQLSQLHTPPPAPAQPPSSSSSWGSLNLPSTPCSQPSALNFAGLSPSSSHLVPSIS